MRRTRADDNTASKPAKTDTETPGYYTDGPPGTILSADDANMIQEELVAIALGKGGTLDDSGANDHQAWDCIEPAVLSVEGYALGTADVTTQRKNVAVASSGCQVGVVDEVGITGTLASSDSFAKGIDAAVVGCAQCTAEGPIASGAFASYQSSAGSLADDTAATAVVATIGSTVNANAAAAVGGTAHNVTGDYSVALGGDDAAVSGDYASALGGQDAVVSGDFAAVVGGESNTASGADAAVVGGEGNVVSGLRSGTIASYSIEVSGTDSASIASSGSTTSAEITGDNCLLAATTESKASGAQCAVVGGTSNEIGVQSGAIIGGFGNKVASGANTGVVMLASYQCDAALFTAAKTPAYSVCGGYGASVGVLVQPTWRIESNGGHMHAAAYDVGGLDYAEFFANADGVEHPKRRIVSRKGKGARMGRRGSRILGVVSVTPGVLGGDDALTANGPTKIERPDEFTVVGLLGQLEVEVDATVRADDDVLPGPDGRGTRRRWWQFWRRRGAQIECMEIVQPFDAALGYGVALCIVR